MSEKVMKEMQKNIEEINKNFAFVLDGLPTKEIVKLEFDGIRLLVDYCEQLALKGESAIENL